MHNIGPKVSLRRFIQVGELLDHAFPDPIPAPDYLVHECELAEQALLGAGIASGATTDPLLAELFSLPIRKHRSPRAEQPGTAAQKD